MSALLIFRVPVEVKSFSQSSGSPSHQELRRFCNLLNYYSWSNGACQRRYARLVSDPDRGFQPMSHDLVPDVRCTVAATPFRLITSVLLTSMWTVSRTVCLLWCERVRIRQRAAVIKLFLKSKLQNLIQTKCGRLQSTKFHLWYSFVCHLEMIIRTHARARAHTHTHTQEHTHM